MWILKQDMSNWQILTTFLRLICKTTYLTNTYKDTNSISYRFRVLYLQDSVLCQRRLFNFLKETERVKVYKLKVTKAFCIWRQFRSHCIPVVSIETDIVMMVIINNITWGLQNHRMSTVFDKWVRQAHKASLVSHLCTVLSGVYSCVDAGVLSVSPLHLLGTNLCQNWPYCQGVSVYTVLGVSCCLK